MVISAVPRVRDQRGVLLLQRVSLSFAAIFLGSGVAHAHHPGNVHFTRYHWAALALFLAIEVAFVLLSRRGGPPVLVERAWMATPVALLVALGFTWWASSIDLPARALTRESVVLPSSGADGLEVNVTARQWQWEARYASEGLQKVREIHVPIGQVLRLRLKSADVLHTFEVPGLSMKVDVHPKTIAVLNLKFPRAVTYQVRCSAVCGTSKDDQMATVIAVDPPDEYNRWVENQRSQETVVK